MPSDSETPGSAHSSSETNPPNQQNQASTNVPRSGLSPFPPFDPLSDRASLGLRWRKWSIRFENLLITLRELDPNIRRGLYVGEATNDIFNTLSDTGTDYNAAIASLTAHFDPVRNKDMDIYEFCQIKQEPGEALQNFHQRLKEKSILCKFPNEDGEIKTQIIHNTSDSRIRRKVL